MKTPKKRKAPAPKKPNGRPPTWTPERRAAAMISICEKIAQKEPVHRFAGKDGLPSESVIYEWLAEDRSFAERYAHARARAAERFAFGALEIAENTGRVVIEKAPDGTQQAVTLTPDVARVRVDVLKWAAGKFAPKVYGDRIHHQHSALDGFDWSKATPEQLRAIAAGKAPE